MKALICPRCGNTYQIINLFVQYLSGDSVWECSKCLTKFVIDYNEKLKEVSE